jgi:asparagine synthase (glutamine-hydrolysing)
MCGFAGLVFFEGEKKVSKDVLKAMTDSIHHRGPDDEGFLISDNIGLGFRRLSIIDLNTGHQPLADSTGSVWITFNGEIYNYRELRTELEKKNYRFLTKSDTEVIINAYLEYGFDCVSHLRGMFSFILWDKKNNLLFGARDRLGIKPFYYYHNNGRFIWGSEIKAIRASGETTLSLDPESLDQYFAYGYIMNDRSIFREIKKLPAANYIVINYQTAEVRTNRYWEIKFEPDYSKSQHFWEEKIAETFREAIKLHMISDVPIGAFLSGGIDSSIVVSQMAQLSTGPINTFSIGFKDKKYNELEFARQIAAKYKTNHREMIVEPDSLNLLPLLVHAYDEPFFDSSAIPTYYVSKFAREFVTVVLTGDGGDELFAGYNSYSQFNNYIQSPLNRQVFKQLIINPLFHAFPSKWKGKGFLYYLNKPKTYIPAYACLWRDYERSQLYNSFMKENCSNRPEQYKKIILKNSSTKDDISRMQDVDLQTYLPDDILTKVDRVSMLNSLESRVPLLDHKFVELSFLIPSEFKMKGNNKKFILKETFKQQLPEDIISHPKHGFSVPISEWFKGNSKEFITNILNDKNALIYDFTDHNYVKTIIKRNDDGLKNQGNKIWSLLFLEEWLQQNKE